MHKLPLQSDIQSLINKIVIQVGYTIDHICLYWDDGFLQIMAPFSISYQGAAYFFQELYPIKTDCNLLGVLDKKIVGIEISDIENTMSISFEDEVILLLYNDTNYESFEINLAGRRIIV